MVSWKVKVYGFLHVKRNNINALSVCFDDWKYECNYWVVHTSKLNGFVIFYVSTEWVYLLVIKAISDISCVILSRKF